MTRDSGRLGLTLVTPVVVTVLIAAVIGSFIVVQSQRQSDQLELADAAAADYLSAVATFRAGVVTAVEKADQKSPAAIRKALVAAIKDPPVLADADASGMESSGAYAQAAEIEGRLLDPYEALNKELKQASVSLTFVKAARAVLGMRITDYLSSTTLSNSSELRSSLIPAFVSARDRFAAIAVPKGQETLAAAVTGAVQYLIDQATTLANNIDAGRNYSFTYATQFEAAITAVEDYSTQVTGDVTESLNNLKDL